MSVAVMTPEIQMSHSFPPAEAWLNPKKHLNLETGQILPGHDRLVLPVDDRKFVIPDRAIKQILAHYFKPDYRWGYDQNNPHTKPNDHHIYYDEAEYLPGANNGSFVPQRFRELPTVIGRMPWQFHNVIHSMTEKPEMPSITDMEEYLMAYDIAYKAFRNLFDKAKNTVNSSGQFPKRRSTLANGTIPRGGGEDIIGQEYMIGSFRENFKAYSDAIEIYRWAPNKEVIDPNYREFDNVKPIEVVRRLGRLVTRNSINYMPMVTGRAA